MHCLLLFDALGVCFMFMVCSSFRDVPWMLFDVRFCRSLFAVCWLLFVGCCVLFVENGCGVFVVRGALCCSLVAVRLFMFVCFSNRCMRVCSSLFVVYYLLCVVCYLSIVRCALCMLRCRLFAVCCKLCAVQCLLFVGNGSLFWLVLLVVCCRSFAIVCCLLFARCCLLCVVCCFLLFIVCSLTLVAYR